MWLQFFLHCNSFSTLLCDLLLLLLSPFVVSSTSLFEFSVCFHMPTLSFHLNQNSCIICICSWHTIRSCARACVALLNAMWSSLFSNLAIWLMISLLPYYFLIIVSCLEPHAQRGDRYQLQIPELLQSRLILLLLFLQMDSIKKALFLDSSTITLANQNVPYEFKYPNNENNNDD